MAESSYTYMYQGDDVMVEVTMAVEVAVTINGVEVTMVIT